MTFRDSRTLMCAIFILAVPGATSAVALGTSTPAEATAVDPAALILQATQVQESGCSQTDDAGAVACGRVPGLLADLAGAGEFLAVAVTCASLDGKSAIPSAALMTCAGAEARLGSTVTASKYLDKAVSLAGDGADRLDALLSAARLLMDNARYQAAAPFLAAAASLAAKIDPARLRDIRKLRFSNCLDSDDQRCARQAASDLVGTDALFVVREYLSRDMPGKALETAKQLLNDGVSSLDELSVLVSTFAALKMTLEAIGAATACLSGCPGADTGTVAGALTRSGLAADAARFAERNRGRFATTGDADFEIAFLWLQAGNEDKALRILVDWALPPAGRGDEAIDYGSRQVRVEKRLLSDGIFKTVAMFGEAVRKGGGRLSSDVGPQMVSACLKSANVGAAMAAASELLTAEAGCGPLRFKLATLFLDADEHDSSVSLLEPCSSVSVSVSPDPLLPARIHLLRARLIVGGHAAGDADVEILAAFKGARGDADLVASIDRLAATAGVGKDVMLVAAEMVAASSPKDPLALIRLARAQIAVRNEPAAVAALDRSIATQSGSDDSISVAVDMLLTAGFLNGAVGLLETGSRVDRIPAALASRIGEACLASGDRVCVSRYLDRFFLGPVSDDVNYFAIADSLIGSGYLQLAQRALDVAGKAYPYDRTGREQWLRGRLALVRGDRAGAERHYRQAIDGAQSRALIIMAVTADYARAGYIAGSMQWLAMGIADESSEVRAQIFPTWVDTLRRLGRVNEITIVPLKDVTISSTEGWGRTIELLAGVGRVDLAIELLGRVKNEVAASSVGPVLVDLVNLHCRARDAAGATAAANSACAWAVSFGGDSCIEAARIISNSGLGGDPVAIINNFGAASIAGASAPGLASLVMMTLLEGGVGPALEAAGRVSPALLEEGKSAGGMWPLLPTMAGVHRWDEFVSDLAARKEFADGGRIFLDASMAAFGAGDQVRARDLMARYVASPAGNLAQAVVALISDGWFDDAVATMKSAPDRFWKDLDSQHLRLFINAFLGRERPGEAEWVIARFSEVNGGSAAAREMIAGVRYDMGDFAGAVRELAQIPETELTESARVIVGAALWRLDDRAGAMKYYRKVVSLPLSGESRGSAQYKVMNILDSEAGASAELAEILGVYLDKPEPDAGLIMASALVDLSVQDKAHLESARARLFSLLRQRRAVSAVRGVGDVDNIREYVINEARRGSAGSLARQAIAVRGAAFAQTALYAACISGDERTFGLALDTMFPAQVLAGGPDERPDSADLLAVAGICLACGRWDDAVDFSLRYLKGQHVESDSMSQAIIIAVKASAAAGRKNPVTGPFIDGLTDDRLLRNSFRTVAAATSGNVRGIFDALEDARNLVTSEQGLVMESIHAWIVSGQGEGLADFAFERVNSLSDPLAVYPAAFRVMTSSFRYSDAARFAKKVVEAAPLSIQARADLFAALLNTGDDSGALVVARDLVAERQDPAGTTLGLMASAAQARRPAVVKGLVAGITGDRSGAFTSSLTPDLVDGALRTVQFLDAAEPGSETAKTLMDASWSWARDREHFCASAVMSIPDAFRERDDGYVGNVTRLFSDGRCAAPAMVNRLADIVAALAGGADVTSSFKASWPVGDMVRLIRTASSNAILQGRTDDAISWFKAAGALGMTLSDQLSMLVELTDYLSDRPELPEADVRRIAAYGRDFMLSQIPGDNRFVLAGATFVVLAEGAGPFTGMMDAEIRLDPSNEHHRNMVAYSLSVRGKDKARFKKEVSMAVAMGGADRGGYLETEAWGMHVFGKTGKAIDRQRAASAYWSTTDYGTGLPECWNHFGAMLESAGRWTEAAEMYRRSAGNSDGWDWHGILSHRRLRETGYYEGGASGR